MEMRERERRRMRGVGREGVNMKSGKCEKERGRYEDERGRSETGLKRGMKEERDRREDGCKGEKTKKLS